MNRFFASSSSRLTSGAAGCAVRSFSSAGGSSSSNSSASTSRVTVSASLDDKDSEAPSSSFRKRIVTMENRPIIKAMRKQSEEHEAKAAALGLSWRTLSASIMHRYPTVTSDSEPWERDMWAMQDKIEGRKREHFMSQVGGTDAQMIPDDDPTYEEILESLPFKPASRVTEADEKNDRHSMDRKLPESLFLIVKRNRADNAWQFPQGKLQDSETNMRVAAERVLDRAVGKTKRYFISNAPVGHLCYAYPPDMQQQRKQYGAKVYFYRSQLLVGAIKLETRLYTDYAWIARSEVGEYFDKPTAAFFDALLPY